MNRYLDIAPEVKEALDAGKPVVALESTIISHGMPYPQNVETALKVESIIREAGAVPATIAIIGGLLILLPMTTSRAVWVIVGLLVIAVGVLMAIDRLKPGKLLGDGGNIIDAQ